MDKTCLQLVKDKKQPNIVNLCCPNFSCFHSGQTRSMSPSFFDHSYLITIKSKMKQLTVWIKSIDTIMQINWY